MRKSIVLLILTVLVSAGPASAQFGHIGLYTDGAARHCDIDDVGQGLVDIYVIHTLVAGATAAQFKVVALPGFKAPFIGFYSPFPTVIGSAPTGVAIGYGTCLSGPILLLKLTYVFVGLSSACGYLEVVGDPAEIHYPNDPVVVDCEPMGTIAKHPVQGGKLFVNPDGSCPCFLAVPVRESTWGQVKALYGE